MDVRLADTEAELDDVRRLFRSFLAWHRERHIDDLALIDAYFDEESWEAEVTGLPGAYGPPDGALLLATEAGLTLGCVGSKRLDDESCEMKRMFVAPVARGRGVGRALAEAVVERARADGYRRMYLDTSIRQTEAIALYRSLGFTEVAAYHDVPDDMAGWLVFYCLEI
jgi:GNAT superfamily N-acetyltransferase